MGRRVVAIETLFCLMGLVAAAIAQQEAGAARGGGAGSGSPRGNAGSAPLIPGRGVEASEPRGGMGMMGGSDSPRAAFDDEAFGDAPGRSFNQLSPDEVIDIAKNRSSRVTKELLDAFRNAAKGATEAKLSELDSARLVWLWTNVQSDSDREKVQKALRESVKREFLARLQPQEEEVKALEAKVWQLRSQLDLRRSKQDEIVDFRAQQLVREAQGLGWGTDADSARPRGGSGRGAGSPSFGYRSVPVPFGGAGGTAPGIPSSDPMGGGAPRRPEPMEAYPTKPAASAPSSAPSRMSGTSDKPAP